VLRYSSIISIEKLPKEHTERTQTTNLNKIIIMINNVNIYRNGLGVESPLKAIAQRAIVSNIS